MQCMFMVRFSSCFINKNLKETYNSTYLLYINVDVGITWLVMLARNALIKNNRITDNSKIYKYIVNCIL